MNNSTKERKFLDDNVLLFLHLQIYDFLMHIPTVSKMRFGCIIAVCAALALGAAGEGPNALPAESHGSCALGNGSAGSLQRHTGDTLFGDVCVDLATGAMHCPLTCQKAANKTGGIAPPYC